MGSYSFETALIRLANMRHKWKRRRKTVSPASLWKVLLWESKLSRKWAFCPEISEHCYSKIYSISNIYWGEQATVKYPLLAGSFPRRKTGHCCCFHYPRSQQDFSNTPYRYGWGRSMLTLLVVVLGWPSFVQSQNSAFLHKLKMGSSKALTNKIQPSFDFEKGNPTSGSAPVFQKNITEWLHLSHIAVSVKE